MKLNSRRLLPLLLYYLSCHTGNTYSEEQVDVRIKGPLARMLCVQYRFEGNFSKTPPKPHKHPLYKGFDAPCRIIHRRICGGSADCQQFSSSRKRPCDEKANLSQGEFGKYFEGDLNIPQPRAGTTDKIRRWPNRTRICDGGVVRPRIPYEEDPDLAKETSVDVRLAVSHIESCTCIRFEKKEPVHDDWVYITGKEAGCFVKHIGRTSGQLTMNVNSGNCAYGNVVHEFVHAIGFWHEHTRPDRDEYVTIFEQNIETGKEGNFQKRSTSESESFGEKYDYNSIMHYPTYAFAKESGLNTIEVKDPKAPYIGQRDALSRSDVIQLNRMYGCSDNIPSKCKTYD